MAASLPSNEDDLTTCSVCFDIYDVNKNCPKFLSCHHTFCLACIGGIVTQGTLIKCPTCRVVTTLPAGNTLSQLRTNSHALKLAEYFLRAPRNKPENDTKLHSELTQEIAELEKADKHLKLVVESLNVLWGHATNAQSENTARLKKLKKTLGSLDSAAFVNSTSADSNLKQTQTDFSITLGKVQDFQLGLNLESVSGRLSPMAKRIKLDVLIPISEGGITAANLNVMNYSLLHFFKDDILKQPTAQLLALPAVGIHPLFPQPTATPPVTVPAQRSPPKAPAVRSQNQVPAANAVSRNAQTTAASVPKPVVTPKICYMRLNLNGVLDLDSWDEECDLVFETTPQSCAMLCKMFERGCRHTSDVNYRNCSFLRACPAQFVLFGLDEDSVQYSVDPSLVNKPLIRQRGDVGLYCECADDDSSVWDFVILLSDYNGPHNLRPAPVVATLVLGFELCEELSRLRADERDCIEISYIRVH